MAKWAWALMAAAIGLVIIVSLSQQPANIQPQASPTPSATETAAFTPTPIALPPLEIVQFNATTAKEKLRSLNASLQLISNKLKAQDSAWDEMSTSERKASLDAICADFDKLAVKARALAGELNSSPDADAMALAAEWAESAETGAWMCGDRAQMAEFKQIFFADDDITIIENKYEAMLATTNVDRTAQAIIDEIAGYRDNSKEMLGVANALIELDDVDFGDIVLAMRGKKEGVVGKIFFTDPLLTAAKRKMQNYKLKKDQQRADETEIQIEGEETSPSENQASSQGSGFMYVTTPASMVFQFDEKTSKVDSFVQTFYMSTLLFEKNARTILVTNQHETNKLRPLKKTELSSQYFAAKEPVFFSTATKLKLENDEIPARGIAGVALTIEKSPIFPVNPGYSIPAVTGNLVLTEPNNPAKQLRFPFSVTYQVGCPAVLSASPAPLLDSSGKNIYFNSKGLFRIVKTGESKTSLVAASMPVDSSTSQWTERKIMQIAVDTSSVYWLEKEDTKTSKTSAGRVVQQVLSTSYWIRKLPLAAAAGTKPKDVVMTSSLCSNIVADQGGNGFVWWIFDEKDGAGTVLARAPKDGGDLEPVVEGKNLICGINTIVGDENAIYYIEKPTTGRGKIVKLNKADKKNATIATNVAPSALYADSDSIYWIERSGGVASIKKVSKNGGTVTTVAASLKISNQGIAVDDKYIYVVDDTSNVKRIPKKGGAVSTVYSSRNVASNLVVDDEYVYFGTKTALVKIPKAGCPAK